MKKNLFKHSVTDAAGNVELKDYSIFRAINSALTGENSYEKEVSEDLARALGKNASGIYIPMNSLVRASDFNTTTGAGLIQDSTGEFIDLIKNSTVLAGLGARFVSGLTGGKVNFPKKTGTAQTYWVGEDGAVTNGNMTVGEVPLTPSTVGARTQVSRSLLKQSSYDAEALVVADLASSIAQAIELAVINGSGQNNEPLGLLQRALQTVTLTNDTLTWADVVKMESMIQDGVFGNFSYLTNRQIAGLMKSTQKGSGVGFINEGGMVNGYECAVTNNVPSNLGVSQDLSAMIFGNFADVLIGSWGALDLIVDDKTASSSGSLILTALQDVGIAIRNTGSFTICKNIAV